MPTVKARLEDVQRDLGKIERLWMEAIRECGSAYSQAYLNHSKNLPKQLPPDAHVVLIGKVISGVAGPGAGAVLNPLVAALVVKALESEIEEFANKIGSHKKPGPLGDPNIDTPQKYQNDYMNYVSRIFGGIEEKVDWLLEIIDGITKASVEVTHKHVDLLIDIINRSPITHAPAGAASWNSNKALETEMEKAMWAMWILQLQEDKGAKLKLAADLDIADAVTRMQALKLLDSRMATGGGYKVRMAVLIAMLKWAQGYQPARPFTGQMPYPAKQAARSASSKFISQANSSAIASRELRRMVLEGVA